MSHRAVAYDYLNCVQRAVAYDYLNCVQRAVEVCALEIFHNYNYYLYIMCWSTQSHTIHGVRLKELTLSNRVKSKARILL